MQRTFFKFLPSPEMEFWIKPGVNIADVAKGLNGAVSTVGLATMSTVGFRLCDRRPPNVSRVSEPDRIEPSHPALHIAFVIGNRLGLPVPLIRPSLIDTLCYFSY